MVSNLLWHDRSEQEPEPIKLRAQSFDIVVAPVEEYSEIAQRLTSTHGTEPTALVSVESLLHEHSTLEDFKEFMDDLLYVFRLVTGNKVDWYYVEAVDGRTGEPVERIHKYTETGLYSNAIRFRPPKSGYDYAIPKLELAMITDAFFSRYRQCLDRTVLKALINQFTSACDVTSYIESQGLLAATLTELIAAKYAYTVGNSNVLNKSHFENTTLVTVKKLIEEMDLPTQTKRQMYSHLKGAYRSSFRRNVRTMNKRLRLGLRRSEIDRIVNVRNSLVHEGTYGMGLDAREWSEYHRLMTWTNFVALCRLMGYGGELPQFRKGRRLEI